jgi:hypothetical protein
MGVEPMSPACRAGIFPLDDPGHYFINRHGRVRIISLGREVRLGSTWSNQVHVPRVGQSHVQPVNTPKDSEAIG